VPPKPEKIKIPSAEGRRAEQRSDHKEAAAQRMSYGSGPHRAAMGLLRRMGDEAEPQ
jgi:hypothetical protein